MNTHLVPEPMEWAGTTVGLGSHLEVSGPIFVGCPLEEDVGFKDFLGSSSCF